MVAISSFNPCCHGSRPVGSTSIRFEASHRSQGHDRVFQNPCCHGSRSAAPQLARWISSGVLRRRDRTGVSILVVMEVGLVSGDSRLWSTVFRRGTGGVSILVVMEVGQLQLTRAPGELGGFLTSFVGLVSILVVMEVGSVGYTGVLDLSMSSSVGRFQSLLSWKRPVRSSSTASSFC